MCQLGTGWQVLLVGGRAGLWILGMLVSATECTDFGSLKQQVELPGLMNRHPCG